MRFTCSLLALGTLVLASCTGTVELSESTLDSNAPTGEAPGDSNPGSDDDSADSVVHQAALDLMAARCTACHGAGPSEFNGDLDLSPASMEEFADRLVNRPSSLQACDGERLINSDNTEESLFLAVVDSRTAKDAECIGKMPLGTDGLTDEEFELLREWVVELTRIGSDEVVDDTVATQTSADAAPVSPLTALRKAKLLATGQVPTAAELDAVTDENGALDDEAFSELIEQWVDANNPDFVRKRRMFLRSVLQQNGSIGKTNRQLVLTKLNDRQAAKFYPNLNDMYVKTAEWIADEDADFRTLFTDDWAMVTTGALVMLQMADWPLVRHKFGGMTRDFNTQGFKYILELYNDDTSQMDADTSDWRRVRLTYETDPALHNRDVSPFYTGDIITQMRAVGEGDEIALRVPRTICSSIPFFTAWETNQDNKFRGPMNQCVILALNSSFSPSDLTSHPDAIPPGLNPEEFPLDSTCYACHKNMEPSVSAYTRHFDVSHNRYVGFSQSEVDDYNALREQYLDLDPNRHGGWMTVPSIAPPDPLLIYEGVNTPVANLKDWVSELALHPGFAKAWVMKLAQWALSEPVDPNDPEVIRLAEAFAASNFSFHKMVRAFLASKFITHGTLGEDANFAGNSVSLLRQDHFCQSMEVRLRDIRLKNDRTSDSPTSTTDFCGFNGEASRALPKSGLERGSIELTLPKQSDAFSQISLEQLCKSAGEALVGKGSSTFLRDPAALESTVEDLVAGLLGLPVSSPEHAEAKTSFLLLYERFRGAPECATGEDFGAALEADTPTCGLNHGEQLAMETLVSVACQDPRTTSIGL